MIPSAIRVKKTLHPFLLPGGLTSGSIMFQSTEEQGMLASPSCLLYFPPIQLWNSPADYRKSTERVGSGVAQPQSSLSRELSQRRT
jgi:hypothetical protein